MKLQGSFEPTAMSQLLGTESVTAQEINDHKPAILTELAGRLRGMPGDETKRFLSQVSVRVDKLVDSLSQGGTIPVNALVIRIIGNGA